MPMRLASPIGRSSCARRTWSRPGGPSCEQVFPEGTVEVHVLEKWTELLSYPRGKPTRPTWLIMGETLAKNGPYWRAAAVKDSRGVLRCPDCGAQLRGKASGEGNFLSMKDLERSRKRCTAEVPTRRLDNDGEPVIRPCGAALWQYIGKPAIWAPADYIHKHMQGVFDYLICDEVHEEKSETSARANALGALVASCRKVIAMTGTLIGGKAGHVRSLLFRLSPKSLKAENLAWQDDMEFARRYGRVDTIVTEKTSPACDNRRSNGKSTTKRQAEQPGIMPTLYGRHLIGNTIFLSLKDVAADLPAYDEHPTPVRMSADLAEPYREMEGEAQGRRGRALAARQPPTSLRRCSMPCWPIPIIPMTGSPSGTWMTGRPQGDSCTVTAPPTLDSNTPLAQGTEAPGDPAPRRRPRAGSAGCSASTPAPIPCLERLEKIIQEAGFTVKVLDADKVPTRSRSAWIAKNAPGVDVIISHPQPVRTGLTLFDAMGAHNFPSLIFYETGYDLFTLRQASRRSWRIGQKHPCRVYYLYYQETMQARAMAPDGPEARRLAGPGRAVLRRGPGRDVRRQRIADDGTGQEPGREHRLRRCRAGVGEVPFGAARAVRRIARG